MGITSRLAEFVANTTFDDLPDDVVARSKEMMLNACAVGIAGSRTHEGQLALEYARRMGGEPQCTILGTPGRFSAANAALVNGTMVHALDYDEVILRRANHPSNVVLPTALAVGELTRCSGRDLVAAFALGCEVSTKVGAAGDFDSVIPALNRNGWHIESVGGTVAAAALSAKLLGLDADAMEIALGIAVSQACGVQVNYGTSTKSLHCGLAASHGIMAAMLAESGFSAARGAIEDINGFFGCFRRDVDVDEEEFMARLGRPFDVIDPGVGLKLYPCGSALHTAIDVMLLLADEHSLTADNVREIHVSWPPRAGNRLTGFAHPRTGLEAKFSMNYCIAVALVHGPPRLHHFTDEAVHDPAVVSVLDRIEVRTDEVATIEVPRPCTIRVVLADGREVSHRGVYASGHPGHPLTERQLNDKFRTCADNVLDDAVAEKVISNFRAIEDLADVTDLVGQLGGPRPADVTSVH
jgi:2-methylcitrate dehydratase PrpD